MNWRQRILRWWYELVVGRHSMLHRVMCRVGIHQWSYTTDRTEDGKFHLMCPHCLKIGEPDPDEGKNA